MHFKVVYSEPQKSHDKLVQINKGISIYQKHLRILALEVYKTLCTLTQILCGMSFTTNLTPCNFRKRIQLSILHDETVNFEVNSLTFRGSLSWNNLPLTLS